MRKNLDGSLEWTVDDIVREYGVPRATVYRRLKAAGLDASGPLSTIAVHNAIFGDQHAARMKLLAAQTKQAELRAGKLSGDLVEAETIGKVLLHGLTALRSIVEHSDITDDELANFLLVMRNLIADLNGVEVGS